MDVASSHFGIAKTIGIKGRSLNSESLWAAAVELQRYLDSLGHRFCFIGGVAVQRWAEPRLTRDVDVTLLVEFGSEVPVVEKILEKYQPRVENPIQFAIQSRVLLAQNSNGIGIDLALGGMPYEQRLVDRATEWGIQGTKSIKTCSAEDLVVLKCFANRPRDWTDVENVIIRQGNKLDRALIKKELEPLLELKEEPELMDHLDSVFAKC